VRAGNSRAAAPPSRLHRCRFVVPALIVVCFPHAAPQGHVGGFGQKPIRRLIRLLSFATIAPSLRGCPPGRCALIASLHVPAAVTPHALVTALATHLRRELARVSPASAGPRHASRQRPCSPSHVCHPPGEPRGGALHPGPAVRPSGIASVSGGGKASSPDFFHLAAHLQRVSSRVSRARDEKTPGPLLAPATPRRKGGAVIERPAPRLPRRARGTRVPRAERRTEDANQE